MDRKKNYKALTRGHTDHFGNILTTVNFRTAAAAYLLFAIQVCFSSTVCNLFS